MKFKLWYDKDGEIGGVQQISSGLIAPFGTLESSLEAMELLEAGADVRYFFWHHPVTGDQVRPKPTWAEKQI